MSSNNSSRTKTKVLIIGGGIGGLTMGILMERAQIDYLILERAPSIRPLGSAIALSSVVQPLFSQLGILDEIRASSKSVSGMTLLNEPDQRPLGSLTNLMKGADIKERYGYYTRVMPRPTFYDILLKHLPRSKLVLSKKVVSFEEYEQGDDGQEGGVIVTCADGTEYDTQILVGSDGAYSTIRSIMYGRLNEKNLLPKQDLLPLRLRQHSVLGVTEPLRATPDERERYRECFASEFSDFKIVMSQDRKYMFWVMPTTDDRICWLLNRYHDETEAQVEESQVSCGGIQAAATDMEWGQEAVQEMLGQTRDFKCPYSGTVGELVDRTTPHLISKVTLEEKLFKTWYHGRTIMIGDAVHKLVPFSGEGGAQAILDAVTLANVIYDVKSVRTSDITTAFETFYQDRFPVAQGAIDFSKQMAGVLNHQGWIGEIIRKITFGYLPAFIARKLDDKINDKRPQAAFLPIIPVPGLVKPRWQKMSERKIGEGPLTQNPEERVQAV
ncbi:hypothetical protein BG011_003268 [Mortierella polycephala]|uniref:FAD-binding domain-containing protein n=1 Tax=Mortierella polycephala TaxID=41804 RepID=A0A9P6Q3F0_9FUNG|nr:hypothetical protein BG011_003268 [Mortierella polycephala]